MPEPFVEVEGLRRAFDGVEALRGVSFRLERGDVLALFGPNGAGKSTLLRILSTLLPPSAGSVRVDGVDIRQSAGRIRARLGMVSHQTFLYADLTARENLEFYAALYGVPDPWERAEALLELVGLRARADSRVADLSRGMQQRLAVARALVNDPDLLLLDEPFTGLDEHAAARLAEHLALLHDRKRTVILVTHNLRRGLEAATRVGVLVAGRLVFFAARADVSAAEFERTYIGFVEAR